MTRRSRRWSCRYRGRPPASRRRRPRRQRDLVVAGLGVHAQLGDGAGQRFRPGALGDRPRRTAAADSDLVIVGAADDPQHALAERDGQRIARHQRTRLKPLQIEARHAGLRAVLHKAIRFELFDRPSLVCANADASDVRSEAAAGKPIFREGPERAVIGHCRRLPVLSMSDAKRRRHRGRASGSRAAAECSPERPA